MPVIKWDLNLSTIVQIFAILATLAFGYGQIDSRLTMIERKLEDSTQTAVRRDVQAERDARSTEALREIDRRLARIESRMK